MATAKLVRVPTDVALITPYGPPVCLADAESDSVCRIDPDFVIHGTSNPLFAAEISFGCLNRNLTEQKLDLFEFASCSMAKPSTGPEVVRGNFSMFDFAHTLEPRAKPLFRSVSLPRFFPILWTGRIILPGVIFAAWSHWSRACFTHVGLGMVLVCPASPLRSTMAQLLFTPLNVAEVYLNGFVSL